MCLTSGVSYFPAVSLGDVHRMSAKPSGELVLALQMWCVDPKGSQGVSCSGGGTCLCAHEITCFYTSVHSLMRRQRSLLNVTEEMLLNLWMIKIEDVFKPCFWFTVWTLVVICNTSWCIYWGFKDWRQLISGQRSIRSHLYNSLWDELSCCLVYGSDWIQPTELFTWNKVEIPVLWSSAIGIELQQLSFVRVAFP